VANGGKLYKPGIIEMVRDSDGHVIEQFQVTEMDHFTGQERNLRLIKDSLVEVVHGRQGTGRKAQVPGITVAGKTGTAQVVRLKQYKHLKEENIPYQYRDHAWFTCFAPAEKPEIAVTVLVEHGLHGGSAAAPIAQAVMQKYFADRLPKTDKNGAALPPLSVPVISD
jgi:penicillin-binding protein 2